MVFKRLCKIYFLISIFCEKYWRLKVKVTRGLKRDVLKGLGNDMTLNFSKIYFKFFFSSFFIMANMDVLNDLSKSESQI